MTHYTILPDGIYWEQEEHEESYGEIELGGVLMQVRLEPGNRATIVRLLRCNLEDYLNPDRSGQANHLLSCTAEITIAKVSRLVKLGPLW
ncbi:hypothetical protein HMSSN036_35950 [Paenibacillus macerans]|nr:hypothetical protein HMSSN036_35950 [Paenibacillus macerans]